MVKYFGKTFHWGTASEQRSIVGQIYCIVLDLILWAHEVIFDYSRRRLNAGEEIPCALRKNDEEYKQRKISRSDSVDVCLISSMRLDKVEETFNLRCEPNSSSWSRLRSAETTSDTDKIRESCTSQHPICLID